MAKVTADTSGRIDFLLANLISAWEELPAVVCEIDEWDLIEQIDYVEEWGPKEALLKELNRYADGRAMTAAQLRQYRKLQALVAENRPVLEQLRAS